MLSLLQQIKSIQFHPSCNSETILITILELPFGSSDKRSALYQVIRHFCIQILPNESNRSGNQIRFMSNQFYISPGLKQTKF